LNKKEGAKQGNSDTVPDHGADSNISGKDNHQVSVARWEALQPGAEGAMSKQQQAAIKAYQEGILKTTHKLLARGIDLRVVSDIRKSANQLGADEAFAGMPTDLRPESPPLDIDKPLPPDVKTEDVKIIKRAKDDFERQYHKLEQLNELQDRVDLEIKKPPGPPPMLLELGGHILLCVVSKSQGDGDDHGSCGPPLGLEHFVKPLRDHRVQKKALQPAIVVLSESLPGDWRSAVLHERVYFIQGSPLILDDLKRAGFVKASAIAVVRQQIAGSGPDCEVSDALVVLAASLIARHMPPALHTAVITDHTFSGSCAYLPTTSMLISKIKQGASSQRPGNISEAFNAIVSFCKEIIGILEVQHVSNFLAGVDPPKEKYEDLETSDYLHHHRFMCGEVFVLSSITALMANMVHNSLLMDMVRGIIQSPLLLLPLESSWVGCTYAELFDFLLMKKNLLAIGLYRSAQAVEDSSKGQRVNEAIPTFYYMYPWPCYILST